MGQNCPEAKFSNLPIRFWTSIKVLIHLPETTGSTLDTICFVENGIMEIVKVRALRTSHCRWSEDGPTNSMILELSDSALSPDESPKEIYRSRRNRNFCIVYQRTISMRSTLGGKCLRQIHRWVSSMIVIYRTILSSFPIEPLFQHECDRLIFRIREIVEFQWNYSIQQNIYE